MAAEPARHPKILFIVRRGAEVDEAVLGDPRVGGRLLAAELPFQVPVAEHEGRGPAVRTVVAVLGQVPLVQ